MTHLESYAATLAPALFIWAINRDNPAVKRLNWVAIAAGAIAIIYFK